MKSWLTMQLSMEVCPKQEMMARLRMILIGSDPAPLEFVSAVFLIGWGIWIGSDHVFTVTPSYAFLASIAPEWQYAIATIGLGLLELAGVLLGGHRTRRWSCLLAAALWAGLSGGMAAIHWENLGTIIYATLAMVNLWTFVLIGIHDGD